MHPQSASAFGKTAAHEHTAFGRTSASPFGTQVAAPMTFGKPTAPQPFPFGGVQTPATNGTFGAKPSATPAPPAFTFPFTASSTPESSSVIHSHSAHTNHKPSNTFSNSATPQTFAISAQHVPNPSAFANQPPSHVASTPSASHVFATASTSTSAHPSQVSHDTSTQAPAPAPFIIEAVSPSPSAAELAERQQMASLFTAAVRRDAYRFLASPNDPNEGVKQSLGAALLGKKSGENLDTFAFVDRSSLSTAHSLPDGWRLLDDVTLINAVDHLGELSELAVTVTRAFEHYLASKVKCWGEGQVRGLSIEFLVAFGRELTIRLDAMHRIRSTKLSDEELRTLSLAPFAKFVDQDVMRRYQSPPQSLKQSSADEPLSSQKPQSPRTTLTQPGNVSELPPLPTPFSTPKVAAVNPALFTRVG